MSTRNKAVEMIENMVPVKPQQRVDGAVLDTLLKLCDLADELAEEFGNRV